MIHSVIEWCDRRYLFLTPSSLPIMYLMKFLFPTERFDEIDIAANTYLFFFAGYESSSATMSFCLYEIALNMNIQQRLHSEVKLIHDKYKTINYDSLKEMNYLDAVISGKFESLPAIYYDYNLRENFNKSC